MFVSCSVQRRFRDSNLSSASCCRYRSITKQFFRKADGVVVMYDITAEQSFIAVRQWITNVKVSQEENPPDRIVSSERLKQFTR